MGNAMTPNAKRLLWAGFFSIFAAGVGFAVRAGILVDWAREYGFTQADLGAITGGGLAGFGFIILIGSLLADKVGYGLLMAFAFLMHVLSAALQMATPLIFEEFGQVGVYWTLYVAMFMFSIGNGMCEVVVNPMVATLFPDNKTHYLNILHAGWPGGLIVGGVIAYVCNQETFKVHWLIQMSLFLIPVAVYGAMLLGQRLPRSEASEAGVSYGEMLAQFASPILILLLIIHALVGYVELGTDSWISKITGSIMESRGAGLLLFIYTSGLMFLLRFFAGPIERATSPLGLLFLCSLFGTAGLFLLGNVGGTYAVLLCVGAATIYGIGKTFFWPTMLAVVSERFPRGGALTIGAVGGVGMLSAGFLGGPGIGFKQDYNATYYLKHRAPNGEEIYTRYAAEEENRFLGVFRTKGLDGTKIALVELAVKANDTKATEAERNFARTELNLTLANLRNSKDESRQALASWWDANQSHAPQDAPVLDRATIYGGQWALILTSAVPATMAVLYLVLIVYFRMRGGYRKVEIDPAPAAAGASH